jgi:hypothetical protein
MRLNGWQRIGIVASVVWAIGGPRMNVANASFIGRVLDVDRANNDFDRCRERAKDAYDSVPRYPLLSANGAFVALVPVALGWLIAYALVYLGRWIRAGFKPGFSGIGHRSQAERVENRARAENRRGAETIRHCAREGLGRAP